MLSQFRQFGQTGQLDECASKVKGLWLALRPLTYEPDATCHLLSCPTCSKSGLLGWLGRGGAWINDKWYLARECEA